MARLSELPGRTLDGKYHLDKLLGQGGMGAVYLATHLGTKRPVALKVIAPQLMGSEEFVERFRREAEAAGRLRHPNVVNVTDFGFTSTGSMNLAYLVMEYLDGGSLGEMLKERGSLPLGVVIDIVEQICLAVNMAHEQGIIHRDLKPDNIWLQPDQRGGYNVKVLDFGLAKLHDAAPSPEIEGAKPASVDAATRFSKRSETVRAVAATKPQHQEVTDVEAPTQIQFPAVDEERQTQIFDQPSPDSETDPEAATRIQPSHPSTSGVGDLSAASASNLTRVGAVMGTPLYMSPEQCLGGVLDMRSDIYSLGVIIYQMLAGEPPFTGDLNELISKHTGEPPAPLSKKRGDLPSSVSELVMSALAKEPSERPPSAGLFAKSLRAAAETDSQILQEGRSHYYNHIPGFLFMSLIIYLPFAIASVVVGALFAKNKSMPSALADVGFWIAVFLFIQVANRLTMAASTQAIHDLRLTRRGALRIRSILFKLLKRIPQLVAASLLADLIALVKLAGLLLPGLKSLVDYSLAPAAVMIEKKSPPGALSRSKTLAGRLRHLTRWATVRSVSFLFCSILFLPAFAATMALIFGGSVSGSGSVREAYPVFLILGWIFIVPFYAYSALPLVMLYFKSRQALGETLEEAAYDELDQGKVSKQRSQLKRKILVWVLSPIIMIGILTYSMKFASTPRQDTLSLAASRGRYKDVQRMLAEGANPNEVTTNHRTPIMSASAQGYADVVKALIEAGADVNAKDGDGDTSLHDTAVQGRTELARLLLEAKADVNAANNAGETALIIGSRKGFVDFVKTLVAAGADPSLKDNKGKTAFEYAEEEGRAEVTKVLTSAAVTKPADR
ncbi:MAG TPA: protein kinase [Blastocatellia bacterium]|nr:protein kinase [Blastocatellia bacterium]